MMFSIAQFEQDGFAIVRGVVDSPLRNRLIQAIGQGTGPGGSGNARGLLRRAPLAAALLELPRVQQLVHEVLGPPAFVVRSLLFDKVAAANWNVPWHQDQIIAVAARRDLAGFTSWSVKEGVPHVRPPAEVLAAMVTLRFHLDAAATGNGPLKVIPGSHRHGYLSSDAITGRVANSPPVTCEVRAGDLVVMRPLLLHASDRSVDVGHRRVVHFDLASQPLPRGLPWHVEQTLAAESG